MKKCCFYRYLKEEKMKKLGILLVLAWSWTLLYASDSLDRQLLQDYLSTVHRAEEMNAAPVWLFNDQIYQQNNAGQWMQAGAKYNNPQSFSAWLQDLADREVCPKEHPGVYFDRTYHVPGLWYCRGFMHTGEKCPYHMDRQFPNGIPKFYNP